MKGPGVGVEGQAKTVFVFEYVTGGGMAGRDLPASWAAEGAAMRRAIVEDFAAVPGVRVVTTVDSRLSRQEAPGVETQVIADRHWEHLEALAAQTDYTVLIAPESDGILAELVWFIEERHEEKLLGPSQDIVELAGDKDRLARKLTRHEVPTPPTQLLGPDLSGFPESWTGPIIIKPREGAGSVDTVVVRDGRCPSWVPRDGKFVAQPYLPGEPMSASFLVDAKGCPTLLAIGRQRIEVDPEGKLSYRGGVIPTLLDQCPAPLLAALEAANTSSIGQPRALGLRGFIGVDFLINGGEITILEINPRPTTSYVGLARLYPPGTIAGAWLAAAEGSLEGTVWPDRLRLPADTPAISFDADGTIRPLSGDDAS